MNYRIPIQVLVYPVRIREEQWEYLMLKRTEETGGFWQGVSGAPEGKEKILNAAKRELLEETGFTPEIIFKIEYEFTIKNPASVSTLYAPGVDSIPVYVFIARIDPSQEPRTDPIEHTHWQWCDFKSALEKLYWK